MVPKQIAETSVLLIERTFDRSGDGPLYRQLYQLLRRHIVDGEIAGGARLPSSRLLAQQLGLSRHTVSTAIDQLLAEGYLVGRAGSGTYVSQHFAKQPQARVATGEGAAPQSLTSRRGAEIAASPRSPFGPNSATSGEPQAFKIGLPAVDLFPTERWLRALTEAWRDVSPNGLGYQRPMGLDSLRESVTTYLRASRGLVCDPAQVVIVAGSQNALDLCFRVLLDPGDTVGLEDPGYLGTRAAAVSAGARMVPLAVDDEGLNVPALVALKDAPKVVFVTPTHQFPLGVTMSLRRRVALTKWAIDHRSWILEDDYDSEYRYGGRPFDPLAVLDRGGRVIYIGTFSKTLFPALRLGYLVVPPGLVDNFEAAQLSSSIHRPLLEQAALVRFMAHVDFANHLRRTQDAHATRRAALLTAAERHLAGLLEVEPTKAGLHLFGRLPDDTDDVAVVRAAAERHVDVWPLSIHGLVDQRRGLLLGFGGSPEHLIDRGVRDLADAIRSVA